MDKGKDAPMLRKRTIIEEYGPVPESETIKFLKKVWEWVKAIKKIAQLH